MGERQGGLRRRDFLAAALAGTAAAMAAVPDARGQARARPTPACGDSGGPTPPQTEGPYFKASSPLRASLLEPGMSGARLVVEGVVLTTACAPIPGAIVDFWQADDRGQYDNAGYRLRGHQLTDGAGRYRLETIVPGLYPGRTRHIHVTVAAPNRPAAHHAALLSRRGRQSAGRDLRIRAGDEASRRPKGASTAPSISSWTSGQGDGRHEERAGRLGGGRRGPLR